MECIWHLVKGHQLANFWGPRNSPDLGYGAPAIRLHNNLAQRDFSWPPALRNSAREGGEQLARNLYGSRPLRANSQRPRTVGK